MCVQLGASVSYDKKDLSPQIKPRTMEETFSPDELFDRAAKRAQAMHAYVLSQRESCEEATLKLVRDCLTDKLDTLLHTKNDEFIPQLAVPTRQISLEKFQPFIERVLAEFNRPEGTYEYRIGGSSTGGRARSRVSLWISGSTNVGRLPDA